MGIIKQKDGFSAFSFIIILSIPIFLISITSSLLDINNSIGNKTLNNIDQMAIAYSEYHRALQLGYDNISTKQGKTEKVTSVIGNNEINLKYGNEATMLGTRYIPVTITVKDKNNKIFTLERKIPSTMPTGYSKTELDDILKGYAYNKSYDEKTDTNIISIKIADGEVAGTKQVFAYLDKEPVQLATTFDMLGKPDWGHVKAVSFPYTATEDGFLWIHLGWHLYNNLYALNVTTAEGVTLDSLMCYDWGGSNFIILNKGDTVRYKHYTNNENMRYFIPYKRNNNTDPPVSVNH